MQNHILEYLDNTILRVPDKIAFANEKEAFTFRDVYMQNRALATFFIKKGYYKEPVVVFMKRHPKMVTAFFGVLNSGNYYVPLDDEMPEMRINLILENLKPRAVICDSQTMETAKEFQYKGDFYLYDELICTEEDAKILAGVRARAIDTDPAYVVFTSGSTGIPKGVVVSHRSVINYIEQLSETLGFSDKTVFGNQTPLYFDACLKELYPTIKFGATTYLLPKSLFMFPVKVVEFLNEHRVNTICWVVSALSMLSGFGTFKKIVPRYLHTVAFGGEVFPVKQLNIWRTYLPDTNFFNLYGPTEGTGVCCYYQVNREFEQNDIIPIGRPFKNTEILLLNEHNRCAVQGEQGEICIRGTSLAMGYYNNLQKTEEVFVQNPLNTAYQELIYRTGDIGKYNEYGELVFISRKDHQIKHMGHRIELGEIEVNVNMLVEITISGCIYDKEKDKIVLYYVGSLQPDELIKRLRERLPRYMLPNHVEKLTEIPLTATGKIDRVFLKEKYIEI